MCEREKILATNTNPALLSDINHASKLRICCCSHKQFWCFCFHVLFLVENDFSRGIWNLPNVSISPRKWMFTCRTFKCGTLWYCSPKCAYSVQSHYGLLGYEVRYFIVEGLLNILFQTIYKLKNLLINIEHNHCNIHSIMLLNFNWRIYARTTPYQFRD